MSMNNSRFNIALYAYQSVAVYCTTSTPNDFTKLAYSLSGSCHIYFMHLK